MKKKPKDRHLDTPAEANRDKHINFLALEAGNADPADLPATGKLSPGRDEQGQEKAKQEGKKRKPR